MMKSTCAGSSGARNVGTATPQRVVSSPNSSVANHTRLGGRQAAQRLPPAPGPAAGDSPPSISASACRAGASVEASEVTMVRLPSVGPGLVREDFSAHGRGPLHALDPAGEVAPGG